MANLARRALPPAVARPAMARARLYAAISRTFLYPTDVLLKGYRSGEFIGLISGALAELSDQAAAPSPAESLAPVVVELTEALAADLETAPRLGDWQEEHLRLFDQGTRVPCPPYETEYTTAHLWQQTQAMADIAGFYRAFGVDSQDSGERPDHLAIELDFMHLLCVKEAVALADGNDEAAEICRIAQHKFIAEHLGTWTGVIAALTRSHGRLRSFSAAAALLDRYVAAEAAQMGVSPKPARRTEPLRKDGVGPVMPAAAPVERS